MDNSNRSKLKLLLISIVIYIFISIAAVFLQYHWITQYQYKQMGNSALNMAEIAANSITVTNAQVKELESLDFLSSLSHPVNQTLSRIFELNSGDNSVKYAYVLRELKPEQVMYQSTTEDAGFYEVAVGTKLDYIWLLDVIVNENEQLTVKNTADYYIDKHRYTHPDDAIRRIFREQKPSYLLWSDEWGTQISGLAPVFSVEGDYIGLCGVDIYSNEFYAYRTRVLLTLILLLSAPTILLTGLYIHLHMKYRSQMNTLAFRDGLTGICNRRHYEVFGSKLLNQARKAGCSLTLVLSDIDNFKHFNDKYGHLSGDKALQSIAVLLEQTAKSAGGFAARYGGEEFAILCLKTDTVQLCQRLRREVEAAVLTLEDGTESSLTMSFGACCHIPGQEDQLSSFAKLADEALYEAKEAGKNTYIIKNKP